MNWKSIEKDGNPKELGRYLVVGLNKETKEKQLQVLKYYNCKGGFNYYGSKRWSHDGMMDPKSITHWAELPDYPKE